VLNILTGFGPQAGAPLCSHRGVDKVWTWHVVWTCVSRLKQFKPWSVDASAEQSVDATQSWCWCEQQSIVVVLESSTFLPSTSTLNLGCL
jgi:hypothetical protein